jgi:deoxyuridine 5'-triphosphate nucleotidohydrolase
MVTEATIPQDIMYSLNDEESVYLLGICTGSLIKYDNNLYLFNENHEHLFKNIVMKYSSQHSCISVALDINALFYDYISSNIKINDSMLIHPTLSDNMISHYIRGIYDTIDAYETNIPKIVFNNGIHINKQYDTLFTSFCKIPFICNDTLIEFIGINCIDFCYMLYKNATIFDKNNILKYRANCMYISGITSQLNDTSLYTETPVFKYKKTHVDAVVPSKSRVSDSGYDLTILHPIKQKGLVTFYDTCISLETAHGWYIDIVPRSSISKTGYILANSVGIIDASYRGNIIIALMKVDVSAPDLELPCRIAQMIPRPIVHIELEEISELSLTERADGGFGSTGS